MSEPSSAHEKEFGIPPDLVTVVPQATTLLGTFSDYINGWSLGCNTADGITLTISRRDDNIVRVVNSTKQDKKKFSLSSIKYRREDKWANAVKAVFFELGRNGVKCGGYSILITGRGCNASPYSLSAEIYAGLTVALNELLSLGWDRKKLYSVSLEASRFTLQGAARWRDLWLLLFGEEGKMYLFDEKTRSVKDAPFDVTPCRSLLFNSDIPYSVLTPEYDEFKAGLSDLVSRFASVIPKDMELRKLSDKEIRYYSSRFSERERRYLMFLNLSSSSARNAFDEIQKGNTKVFGGILSAAQRSLVSNAELTSPELDWIFRRSKENTSVIGMASIDVGIAGSLVAVVDEKSGFPNNQRVDEYERIFGFHPSVSDFAPSSSVTISGK